MIKIKLNSDYIESYDHMFDVGGTDYTWNRWSTGMARREALLKLQNMGLRVPYYDTVMNMDDLIGYNPRIVVYTDPVAHRGEGKEFPRLSTATLYNYHANLAMLFVPQEGRLKISYRYLRVGTTKMWLKYSSDDAWRSNCGNVEITEYHRPSLMQITNTDFNDPEDCPALAIDFVASKGGKWWAIDLNTSPGIDHTPFTDKYSAPEIVTSIKEWFQQNQSIVCLCGTLQAG